MADTGRTSMRAAPRILVAAELNTLPGSQSPSWPTRVACSSVRGTMTLVTRDGDVTTDTHHGSYRFVPLR